MDGFLARGEDKLRHLVCGFNTHFVSAIVNDYTQLYSHIKDYIYV